MTANIGFFGHAKALLAVPIWPEDDVAQVGSILGILARDILVCHLIDTAEVIEAISGLEFEGPGSASPRFYGYDDGVYTNLPYSFLGSDFAFGRRMNSCRL